MSESMNCVFSSLSSVSATGLASMFPAAPRCSQLPISSVNIVEIIARASLDMCLACLSFLDTLIASDLPQPPTPPPPPSVTSSVTASSSPECAKYSTSPENFQLLGCSGIFGVLATTLLLPGPRRGWSVGVHAACSCSLKRRATNQLSSHKARPTAEPPMRLQLRL